MDHSQPSLTVGTVIRKLRDGKNWSLRELSMASGVARGTIAALEQGSTNYKHRTLAALAAAFGKTPAEIEAMTETAPRPSLARRVDDHDMPADFVVLTRKMMALSEASLTVVMIMVSRLTTLEKTLRLAAEGGTEESARPTELPQDTYAEPEMAARLR